jgi:predicted HAD superfamily Cof-like phosphohydrolase
VIALVREFHETYGQAVADAPHVTDDALNLLRLELLREELRELAEALEQHDLVATLDALTDLQYVLDGAYLALGFHAVKDAALVEVHRSNMSKLGDDGRPIVRADGKILKGPRYSPPNLDLIVNKARAEAALDDLAEAPSLDLRLKNALVGQ